MPAWVAILLGAIGPLIGVALGWYLNSRSDATQWYRGEVRTVFADLLVKLDGVQHAVGDAGAAARAQNLVEFNSGVQASIVAIQDVDRAVSTALLLVSEAAEPDLRKLVTASILDLAKLLGESHAAFGASVKVPPDFQPQLEAAKTAHPLTIFEAHQLALAIGRRAMKARRLP